MRAEDSMYRLVLQLQMRADKTILSTREIIRYNFLFNRLYIEQRQLWKAFKIIGINIKI